MKYEETREVFANIATLYYMGEMPQDEIAKIYNISRYKVSRILKKCRSMRIVEFMIHADTRRNQKLEEQLKEALHLKMVIVANAGSTDEETKLNIGKQACVFLEHTLQDGMKVGLSWGTTIQTMVRLYAPEKAYPNTTFVQLTGSIYSKSSMSRGYMDGRELIQRMAKKANANWSAFQVPYIVENPLLRDLMMEESSVKKHVALFKELDIAFIGVGNVSPAENIAYLSGYITLDESIAASNANFTFDVCGSRVVYDPASGKTEKCFTDRTFTIDISTFEMLPTVVALAGGADKASTTIKAAENRYFNVLITDEVCALAMIDILSKADSP